MTTKIISTSPYKKTFETIVNVLLMIILALTVIIRFPDTITYCKKMFSETIGYIFLTIYLTLIIALVVLYYFSRKRKTLGKLTMTSESIEIETIDRKIEFKISELDNFKVDSKYLRTRKELAGLTSSIDNWILFDFRNNTFKYQFPITSSYDGNRFRELIIDWSKNVNFTLIDKK